MMPNALSGRDRCRSVHRIRDRVTTVTSSSQWVVPGDARSSKPLSVGEGGNIRCWVSDRRDYGQRGNQVRGLRGRWPSKLRFRPVAAHSSRIARVLPGLETKHANGHRARAAPSLQRNFTLTRIGPFRVDRVPCSHPDRLLATSDQCATAPRIAGRASGRPAGPIAL